MAKGLLGELWPQGGIGCHGQEELAGDQWP